jgi:dephospho-CoA kinase
MIVIGIVGSPAGGKSTVARRLRELGATWVNADRIAHRCLDRLDVRQRLLNEFGDSIVSESGRIDRRALGSIVFGDDESSAGKLQYLESVVHPATRRMCLVRLRRAARFGVPAAVLDAPLLLEADWGVMCDFVWCVDAPEAMRSTWIQSRGWTTEELRRRESRQLPIASKRRLATHIIDNDSDRQSLLRRVDQMWRQIVPPWHDPTHCS